MSTRPRSLRAVATPRPQPAPTQFRIAVGPGRFVDVTVPSGLTEAELLILVSSIAGGMASQLTSKLVIAGRPRT